MRMIIIMITVMAMSTVGTTIIITVMATATTITTVVTTTQAPMRPGCSTAAPIPRARRLPA